MADTEPQPSTNTQNLPPWLRDAHIINSGSKYAFKPYPVDSYISLPNYLYDVGPFDKEIYTLDQLQRTRTTDLNASSLQIVLNALVDVLPPVLQNQVGLHMTGLPTGGDTGAVIGQPDWFSQSDEDFEKTVQDFENSTFPPLKSGDKQFVLWAVATGPPGLGIPGYVTIVLHYGLFGRITDWAIVDAIGKVSGEAGRIDRVRTRLTRLLPPSHGIADATEHQIWIPPSEPGGICVSGLSAYSLVAQLLDRIGMMHCSGTPFRADVLFAPTRPYFNPDAVRAEALGRAAMKAMEKLDWKARLALFPISSFDDGVRSVVWPGELAPGEIPPLAHALPVPGVSDNASSDEDSLFVDTEGLAFAEELGSFPGAPPMADINVLENYILLKRGEIQRAKEMMTGAKAAAREAAEFSRRLAEDVVLPPNNNVPSAYAVERLFWLAQRATERARSAESQTALLHKCYSGSSIHKEVMRRLQAEHIIAVFKEQLESLKLRYTAIDQNLLAMYTLRKGRGKGQLADMDVTANVAVARPDSPIIVEWNLDVPDKDVLEIGEEAGPSDEQAPAENSKRKEDDPEATSTSEPRKRAKKN
ncbi:hypothetical protein F4679DRAFT_505416 [Xylaria curta]|nr:hypothetical protein F4679DRAFT_505416 [Xylaria curta]